jgi:hypothetical protein
MSMQQVRRSLVEKLHDQATTYRFVWGSELSQLAPGGNRTDGRSWLAMNVPLALTKTHAFARGVRDFRLARRGITRHLHPSPPVDDHGRVRPRHYPPRSCSYLDDELMNRGMYDA